MEKFNRGEEVDQFVEEILYTIMTVRMNKRRNGRDRTISTETVVKGKG